MEGKLLRSARRFAKPFVGQPMGFESSAFRMIKEFKNDYAWLSNFYLDPFMHHGFWVLSGEHAFQMAKAENFEDKLWIMQSATPGIAKRRGRKVTLRADWETVKLDEMLEVTRSKYSVPDLKQLLISTEDQTLVEGNYWDDQFWGDCLCPAHIDTPGKNYLGKILMFVRKELQTDK